jgi:hypothetical protein
MFRGVRRSYIDGHANASVSAYTITKSTWTIIATMHLKYTDTLTQVLLLNASKM